MINGPIEPELEEAPWSAIVEFEDGRRAEFDGSLWRAEDAELNKYLNLRYNRTNIRIEFPAKYWPDYTTAIAQWAATDENGKLLNERPPGDETPGVILS